MHGGGIVAQHMLVSHANLAPLVQVLQPAQAQFADVLGEKVVLGDLLGDQVKHRKVINRARKTFATYVRLQEGAQLVEQLPLLRLRFEDVHFGWSVVDGAQAAQLVEGAEIQVNIVLLQLILLLLLLLLLLRRLPVHVASMCCGNYLLLLLLLLKMLRVRSVLYVRLSIVDAQHRELRALFSLECLKLMLPLVVAVGVAVALVIVASIELLIKLSLRLHIVCNDL